MLCPTCFGSLPINKQTLSIISQFIRNGLLCSNLKSRKPQIRRCSRSQLLLEHQLYLYGIWRKAPARDVHIGHIGFLPSHNVFPDIPREIVNLPGGGRANRFRVIPPKTLISITYLCIHQVPPVPALDNIISYVGSEEGTAKRIPVMLQRVFPSWVILIMSIFVIAGVWVAINALLSLVHVLWVAYHY